MKPARRTARPERATLTWFGHSAFRIVTPAGGVILVDPWLDNPKAPEGSKNVARADLILVTHGHSDHLGNTVELARRTGAKVIGIFEVYLHLQSIGVATASGMNKGGTMEVKGIRVTMVDAKHSSDIDAGGTLVPGGEAAGFIIRLEDGFCIYHAGDTAVFGDMKLIGQIYKPDVALLPIGDLYTMGPAEAAKACELLQPGLIIGMHYGTFPALTGTPAGLRELLPARLKSRLRELVPGVETAL